MIRGGRPGITNAGYQFVSGAGYLGHSGLVRKIEGSLFERDAAGFMRLDFTHDGRVRLSVTTVVPAGDPAHGRERGGVLALAQRRRYTVTVPRRPAPSSEMSSAPSAANASPSAWR